MNTLSNIIPSPLNINKTLNSDYSTTRFATSDYNGKSNTEVISKYKDNTTPNKIEEGFYLGGIGEVGLVMQNIDYINNIIKQYNGTEISLDGKYASSTFYSEQNVSNKQYSLGNIENIWYYDVSYGMISYGALSDPYQSLPLYKYDIKDFDSTEDDYDEYDNGDLFIGSLSTSINSQPFDLISYIYYCQNDVLDNLENTLTYSFYNTDNTRIETYYNKYSITNNNSELLYFTQGQRLQDPSQEWNPTTNPNVYFDCASFAELIYSSDSETFFVKLKSGSENLYYPCEIINNAYDLYYYIYFNHTNGNKYCIYSNNQDAIYKQYTVNLGGTDTLQFSKLPTNLIDCLLSEDGTSIIDVFVNLRYKRIVTLKNDNCIELKDNNIIKYPIYSKEYNNKKIYSFPLLPSFKYDNYYECEFYIFVPEFSKYNKNDNQIINTFNINIIYRNLKVSIKFGDGEIKEILDPYIKLNDVIIYKFKKQWLYDYTFINNQEIVISLIDNSATSNSNKVLFSKKMFFNLYKAKIQSSNKSDFDIRFKFNNYYPLKYPLESQKKFLELDYVPFENVENFSYEDLTNTKLNEIKYSIESDNSIFNYGTETNELKDYKINFNNISNNYSYLDTNIFHNLSETNIISEWFLKENGNGIRIGTGKHDYDNTYSKFTFNIVENDYLKYDDIKDINCYCLNIENYDNNGILDTTSIDIIKVNHTSIDENKINIFNDMKLYGMKQIIYIPYINKVVDNYGLETTNIQKVWNSNKICFEHTYDDNSKFSIFEDYLYIYNSLNEEIKLYFTDESLTLCENTRMITLKPQEFKLYKPSKISDYNIIIKNCLLDQYKLLLYQVYNDRNSEGYINDENKVDKIINDILLINNKANGITGTQTNELFNYIMNRAHNEDNPEIINVPIYDYTIPLFGNVVIIKKL